MHHTLTGNIRLHKGVRSRFVKTPRNVIVYLPPGYNDESERRYPVLYLQDGQNLFDSATAFGGNEWGLDEAAEELIESGQIAPLIIVGIYNAGTQRISEYTHVRNRAGHGGRAAMYGKFIVRELKPLIDAEYRTAQNASDTGLGGSSLGALVSLYLGLQHPDVFGKLIVMSPSVWWANRAILTNVRKLRRKTDQQIWLDMGTCEGENADACIANARALRDGLVAKGWQLGHDLRFVEDEGAEHNEHAWGVRIRGALKFLFPPVLRTDKAEPERTEVLQLPSTA